MQYKQQYRMRLAQLVCTGVVCLTGFSEYVSAEKLVNGGGERVFLVYNESEPTSLAIANHYRHLRLIPSSNLFGVNWQGKRTQIKIDEFRKKILLPLLQEIDKRKLSGQIDHVVYSTGFPYAVAFDSDIRGNAKPKYSVGSITSLTYFFQDVLSKSTGYVSPSANAYADVSLEPRKPAAFTAQATWLGGVRQPPSSPRGARYLLSTMLGYSDGRGNSVEEIANYLRLANEAEGTRPNGKIAFMKSDDIRSTTRIRQFAPVVSRLRELGVSSVILPGVIPQGESRLIGLVMGTSRFDFEQSGSTLLPGAFCDNLTSFGGILASGASQTPATEFLRHGASGACGTVAEPYALAYKFPHASMFLRYTSGSAIAESFYRAVRSPYQILLLGDPLCSPWAAQPKFRVALESNLDRKGRTTGAIELSPTAAVRDLRFKLFVDGRAVAECSHKESLRLDSAELPDGYHELRVVATRQDSTGCCSSRIFPVIVNNNGNTLAANINRPVGQKFVTFDVQAKNADGVQAWCGRRLVGMMNEPTGKLKVPLAALGEGPAQIQLVAVSATTRKAISFSQPFEIQKMLGYESKSPFDVEYR